MSNVIDKINLFQNKQAMNNFKRAEKEHKELPPEVLKRAAMLVNSGYALNKETGE